MESEADLEPMGAMAFIGLWWRYAFPKAWAIAEFIATVWALIGGYLVSQEPSVSGNVAIWAWQLPLLFLAVVFGWRAVTAPYQMRQDVALSRKAIQKELNKKKADKAIADALTVRYDLGLGILKWGPILVQDDWREWRQKFNEWSRDTFQAMKLAGCSEQELVAFDNINPADLPVLTRRTGDEFKDYVEETRNGFGTRVTKLGQIIDAYLDVPIMRPRL